MKSTFEPADNMRRRSVRLVTEEEAAEQELSGDYAPETLWDQFRRAEVWLPMTGEAIRLTADAIAWYGLVLRVGLVPPATVRVTSADIRLAFEPPVSRLGAWDPNDKFSMYREMRIKSGGTITTHLKLPDAARAVLPGIADLLPQLSLEYQKESKSIVVPQDSVIRTTSDGERRVAWQLYEDPKNKIDPRQFTAHVIFGIPPGLAPASPSPMLTVNVECRCGALRMRKAVSQSIELGFRDP